MNYIKMLESSNRTKGSEICAYAGAIQDLREYLLSGKFHNDPTVQVRDVLHRLDQGLDHYRRLLEI